MDSDLGPCDSHLSPEHVRNTCAPDSTHRCRYLTSYRGGYICLHLKPKFRGIIDKTIKLYLKHSTPSNGATCPIGINCSGYIANISTESIRCGPSGLPADWPALVNWPVAVQEPSECISHPSNIQSLDFEEGVKVYRNKKTCYIKEVRMTAEDTKREIIIALTKSIRHVQSVAKREHIKADRMERVGLFVTHLRTCLACVPDSAYYIEKLCDKRLWYDIGELNEPVSFCVGRRCLNAIIQVTEMDLKSWLYMAKSSMHAGSDAEQIDKDLVDLERIIPGFRGPIEQATLVNVQAEAVMKSLLDIFEQEDDNAAVKVG